MNYHNKKFKSVSSSKNSEISEITIFHYKQNENIVSCTYYGDSIITGHLIAKVADNGALNMRYHQIHKNGNLMTGTCQSTPQIMANGKIRLIEKWQWTSGDKSKGASILEEL